MSDRFEIVIDGLWRGSIQRNVRFKHPVTQTSHIIGAATDDQYVKDRFNAWPRAADAVPTPDLKLFNRPKLIRIVDTDLEVVNYTYEVTAKTNQEINQYVRSELAKRTATEMAADFTIGNVTTNRAELETFRDELDGSEISEINLKNDSYTLTIAQQNTIRNNIKARYRAVNKRSYVIAELIKAASPGAARIVVLDAEIDSGWPT